MDKPAVETALGELLSELRTAEHKVVPKLASYVSLSCSILVGEWHDSLREH